MTPYDVPPAFSVAEPIALPSAAISDVPYASPLNVLPLVISSPPSNVIDINGPYPIQHTSPNQLRLKGTPDSPVILRSGLMVGELQGPWEIVDSEYFAILGMGFRRSLMISGSHHFSVAYNDFSSSPVDRGGMGLQNCQNFTVLANDFHDIGDVNATFDQDFHGLTISSYVSNGHILANRFVRCSGDGVQVNAGPNNDFTTHHLYFVSNHAERNKQSGFWVKQASHLVFLHNYAAHHYVSNSSLGQGMGQQYGPEYIWWIENVVEHGNRGICVFSDSGGMGKRSLILGNTLRDIRQSISRGKDDFWQPAAINVIGCNSTSAIRYVINNTIESSDCGITLGPGQSGLLGNSFRDVTEQRVGTPNLVVVPTINDSLRSLYAKHHGV